MNLLIVYLVLFDVITVINIITIFYVFKELRKTTQNNKIASKKVRKHATIKTSNYNNSFNTRGYDQFKNEKTGLYEPQKPHQGIELKSKKED